MKTVSQDKKSRNIAWFAAVVLSLMATGGLKAQNGGYPAAGPEQYAGGDPQGDQMDPPARVGRLSVMQGNVSFQPAGVQEFSAAEMNYPLTTGDRLYTDNGAKAEVEAGQLAIRLGSATDVTVTTVTDEFVQFGLAQGSVHLRTYALDQNNGAEVDTPNASINILQPGDVRIDAYPQDNITIVSVISGQAQVNGDHLQRTLQAGQSIRISNMSADMTRRPRVDELDSFSGQRDAFYQRAYSSEGSYLNPDTIGAADLSAYGDWDSSPDYGAVWYPRSVAADWAPYTTGRWVSIAPWGWTWVGAEPWGFAPFHYGRWNRFGNRWGWIPGSPVVRPVYSPALVVFVGGPGFSLGGGGFSVSIGGGGGVAAWFPLGPREVYRPWYRASAVYTNRVNVTNIYNRNSVEVRNIYNSRRDAYADRRPVNYVNRQATFAVPQRSFGSGRPVREAALRVDPRQFQNAPVMERPPVAAAGRPTGFRPAQGAVPTRTQRPVLETHGAPNPADPRRGGFGGRNGGAPNGGQPNAGQPGRGNGNSPGAGAAYPGAGAAGQPGDNRGNGYGGRNEDGRFNNGRAPVAPGQPGTVAQPAQPVPAAPGQPVRNGYGDRGSDPRGNDGRFTGGRNGGQPGAGTQPVAPPVAAPAAPVTQPGQPVQPGRNGNGYGRGNYGRGDGTQPPATQPVAPAQPAPTAPVTQPGQPVPPGRNGNGYGRGNSGRGDGAQPPATQPVAPAQPAPATQPVAPAQPAPAAPVTQPDRGNPGGRGDGRFGRPGQPAPVAPVQSAPTTQAAPPAQPAPAPQNDGARQGYRRQAPDAPVRVDPPYNRPQPAAPVPQRQVEQPRPVEQRRPEEQRGPVEQPRPQPVAPTRAPEAPQRLMPQARPVQAPPLHPQPAPAPKADDKK